MYMEQEISIEATTT